MIQIAVVEDDKRFSDLICSYIQHFHQKRKIDLFTAVFPDGEIFLHNYEAIYDIIFLDIEMPGMNGMDVARKKREVDSSVIIIFITNMAQYVMHGYEVHATDYVLKPISEYRFATKLQKALKNISYRSKKYLIIKNNANILRLDADEIVYIEVYKHKLQIHTQATIYTTPGSISNVESQLNPRLFGKCNNGCLVNLSYITKIEGNEILLDHQTLSISRGKKKVFLQALADYMGGIML